ncbi:NAD(P)H-dependent oxidoreductase [Vibrio qingdaonensis]|uniref:NAD(P)H-dependent oxidoreductase n=1 Tax=Vibrio qingdaonensis TaxID=2829491 RepID=UPI0036F2C6F1
MKKVLVINANPKRASLCKSLAEEYVAAATGKHEVQQIDIRDLNFELSLNDGYDKTVALEPDLVDFQSKIKWAEHARRLKVSMSQRWF